MEPQIFFELDINYVKAQFVYLMTKPAVWGRFVACDKKNAK